MAYVEFHQALVTHKKVLRMASALKMRRAHVLGHLALLWCWALDNAQDGDLTDIDDEMIKMAADWPKKAETFIGAATLAGFIDVEQGRRTLHDWQDYGGKLIEKRKSDAERKRAERTAHGNPTDGAGTAAQDGAGRETKRNVEKTRQDERNGVSPSPLTSRQWYQRATGKPPTPKDRSDVDAVHDGHPQACIDAVWQQAIDDDDVIHKWPWAKSVFEHGSEHWPREAEEELVRVAR